METATRVRYDVRIGKAGRMSFVAQIDNTFNAMLKASLDQ